MSQRREASGFVLGAAQPLGGVPGRGGHGSGGCAVVRRRAVQPLQQCGEREDGVDRHEAPAELPEICGAGVWEQGRGGGGCLVCAVLVRGSGNAGFVRFRSS